jgi:hypothetical protein
MMQRAGGRGSTAVATYGGVHMISSCKTVTLCTQLTSAIKVLAAR